MEDKAANKTESTGDVDAPPPPPPPAPHPATRTTTTGSAATAQKEDPQEEAKRLKEERKRRARTVLEDEAPKVVARYTTLMSKLRTHAEGRVAEVQRQFKPPASLSDGELVEAEKREIRAVNAETFRQHELQNPLQGCMRFKKSRKVGEGAFGEVFLAEDAATKAQVVVKRVRATLCSEHGGIHFPIYREANLMQNISHPNILHLLQVYIEDDGTAVFVFPFIKHDLPGILRQRVPLQRFSLGDVKCIFGQLMQGVEALHSANVMHRDLKPSNVLVDGDGTVVLCDFGWARHVQSQRGLLTWPPCTLFYRPPELLLGCKHYGLEVDLWGAACILYELLSGKPLFPGTTEEQAFRTIVEILGSPNPKDLPPLPDGGSYLVPVPASPSRSKLRDKCKADLVEDEYAIRLLEEMLQYNPRKRPSADMILKCKWLTEKDPMPSPKDRLQLPPQSAHRWTQKMAEMRKKRNRATTH